MPRRLWGRPFARGSRTDNELVDVTMRIPDTHELAFLERPLGVGKSGPRLRHAIKLVTKEGKLILAEEEFLP